MIFSSLSGCTMTFSEKILWTNKTPVSGFVKYQILPIPLRLLETWAMSSHINTPPQFLFQSHWGNFFQESPLGSAIHEIPFIESSKKKKKDEWALRVSKELLGNPQLVNPRQGTQHTWILVVLYPVCMTLDELPNF